jgi:hypothetical protein
VYLFDKESLKKSGYIVADHPVAILYMSAKNTTGRISLLWSFSDYLCNRALYVSLFCLALASYTSYVNNPPWLKSSLDWCIAEFFAGWKKRSACLDTNCAIGDTMMVFLCNLKGMFKCGAQNPLVYVDFVVFGVVLVVVCLIVLFMCKKITSTILYGLFLGVGAFLLYGAHAFEPLKANFDLFNCKTELTTCLENQPDYSDLARVLKESRVQLENTTDPNVLAYIRYNDGVLDALTAFLDEKHPGMQLVRKDMAKQTIQDTFDKYHNRTISDRKQHVPMDMASQIDRSFALASKHLCDLSESSSTAQSLLGCGKP